jgi:hypothetical protein
MQGEFQRAPLGCAVGRDVRPAAQLLSFVSPKESNQRKGDPAGRVPCASLRGNLRCSVMGRRCGTHCAPAALRSDNRSESEHEAWACCAAHARPTPCASRHGQRGRGSTRAIAALGPGFHPLPLAREGRGEGDKAERSDGPYRFKIPSGCAEERSGRGERVQRSMHPHRDLTRRSCLNEALRARSEFCGAPRTRAPQVARSKAKGRSQWGRVSLPTFFGETKKVGAPPGAHPGQQRIVAKDATKGSEWRASP